MRLPEKLLVLISQESRSKMDNLAPIRDPNPPDALAAAAPAVLTLAPAWPAAAPAETNRPLASRTRPPAESTAAPKPVTLDVADFSPAESWSLTLRVTVAVADIGLLPLRAHLLLEDHLEPFLDLGL